MASEPEDDTSETVVHMQDQKEGEDLDMESGDIKAEAETTEKKNYTLEVMHEIKVAQSQNGLRHGDYQRYRQYCSRRLRRVRKAMDFMHDRKGYKAKLVTPKDVTEAKFLTIPLLNAERAWSYAMQLKNDMTDETRRKKFHLLKRLTKAAKWSTALEQLCHTCADSRSQLEAEAYSSWMHGNVFLEKDQHQEALSKFTHAKTVYERLGQIGGMSLKALCQEKIQALDAPLRYCNYVLTRKHKNKADVDALMKGIGEMNDLLRGKLDAVLGDSRSAEAHALESVDWQGQKLPIKNEKVRLYLITAEDLKTQLDALLKSGVVDSGNVEDGEDSKQDPVSDLLMRIFSAYEDALSTIRSDLRDAEKLKSKGTTGNLGVSEDALMTLKALKAYVTFLKLGVTKSRTFRVASTLAQRMKEQQQTASSEKKGPQVKKVKPDDLVSMYEKVAECISEMAELDTLKLHAETFNAELAFARAFRCFYLAESYRRHKKFPQAYAVFKQTLTRVQQAMGQKQTDASTEQLKALNTEAQAALYNVQASVYLDQEETTQRLKNTSLQEVKSGHVAANMMDGLDEYRSFANLVAFPPDFQATPCKPILFDLALNSLECPDLKHRFSDKKTGWFGGLWGKKN